MDREGREEQRQQQQMRTIQIDDCKDDKQLLTFVEDNCERRICSSSSRNSNKHSCSIKPLLFNPLFITRTETAKQHHQQEQQRRQAISARRAKMLIAITESKNANPISKTEARRALISRNKMSMINRRQEEEEEEEEERKKFVGKSTKLINDCSIRAATTAVARTHKPPSLPRRHNNSSNNNNSLDLLSHLNHHSQSAQWTSFCFIYFLAFATIAAHLLVNQADGLQQQEQASGQATTNLPTVIVRGFLNYRTTVDGTVLLFTPDAGSAQSTSTSQTIQLSSAQQVVPSRQIVTLQTPLVASTTNLLSQLYEQQQSATGGSNRPGQEPRDRQQQSNDDEIRPTQTATNQLLASTIFANNNYQNDQPAATDEWRPIQATPPLEMMQTSIAPPKPVASSSSSKPEKETDLIELTSSSIKEPMVQADDVHSSPSPPISHQSTSTTTTTTESTPSSTSRFQNGRPKRPSLGFNGQGARNRTLGSSWSAQSTTSSPSNNNQQQQPTNQIGSIGLRRPSLNRFQQSTATTSSTTTTTTNPSSADSSSPTQPPIAQTAFQNRIASANQRLKNRFRQRNQQAFANLTNHHHGGGGGSGSLAALVPPTEGGSNRLLDVASIEQPVLIESAPAASWPATASNVDAGATSPVVGSDDAISGPPETQAAASSAPMEQAAPSSDSPEAAVSSAESSDVVLEAISPEQEAGLKALSRVGEQRPHHSRRANSNNNDDDEGQQLHQQQQPKLLVGALQQGQLSSGPLNLEALFQSDQPPSTSPNPEKSASHQQQPEPAASSSEHQPSHLAKQPPKKKFTAGSGHHSHNDKLNGWLDQHHNRFVPRPANGGGGGKQQDDLSQQLVASLAQHQPPAQHHSKLSPSFASNLPTTSSSAAAAEQVKPTPTSLESAAVATSKPLQPAVGAQLDELASSSSNNTLTDPSVEAGSGSNSTASTIQLQTITKTYSTIQTSSKTRLVPLQVKSSTAIYTITENYVITKMLTAYQTMPLDGEFLLTEPLSTRAPYEMFNELVQSEQTPSSSKEQPIVAPPAIVGGGPPSSPADQEQPISLVADPATPPKSANDWLHDFSSLQDQNNQNNEKSVQQQLLANSFLEQQAREANSLAAFGLTGAGPNGGLSGMEPLDQLASSLDPAALLADGTINIPDLNNPIVLAAAIQNPQLAAVILAAQQLQLKQRQQKLNNAANSGPQIQPNQQLQQQASYSTSLSTNIRPSTYTVRDTMYTTRLVSFKDGRTVRTRTVSEPGSVVEQVLTTMATEITPVTITIRPTAALSGPGGPLATAAASNPAATAASSSSQATINNALFAAQLASILGRRQQQLQPSLAPIPQLNPQAATPQQLLAFQQLLNNQQQRQQQQQQANVNNPPKQFQPNFQQLLQSLQQQQQQQQQPNAASSQPSQQQQTNQAQATTTSANNNNGKQQQTTSQQQQANAPAGMSVPSNVPTPPLGPITTTLTNLQVRTYTVHNAFKTIYRTITSTQLITSTIFPGGARSSAMPNVVG